jgi:hypothetical protein
MTLHPRKEWYRKRQGTIIVKLRGIESMNTTDRKACEPTTAIRFTAGQLQNSLPHIQRASAALLECWDRLREAELILDIEMSTDELGWLAGPFDMPEDVERLSVEDVATWLANIVGR